MITKEKEFQITADLIYERGAEFSAPLKADYIVVAENKTEALEDFILGWENQIFFTLDKSSIKIKEQTDE